ncbi:hypothetical protein 000TH008_10 [Bacillus phage 000TH008]|nr:hypothetical protein 000TH008_10 [Bacillus phage 000TH008]QQO40704.1 hypothetical protein 000TH009_10 [Bacillus phage 000TH009]
MFIEVTVLAGTVSVKSDMKVMIRVRDIKRVLELSEVCTLRCEILTYSGDVYNVKESYLEVKQLIERALNQYKSEI